MFKSKLFIVAFFSMLIVGCSSDEVLTPEQENQKIEEYITTKKLTVTEKTSTGLRFILTKANTSGAKLTRGQYVTVNYAGRFLSDKQFDAGNFSFTLGIGQVVGGFDEGVGKMRIGEKATLIFPSVIGYGTSGQGSIPGYSPLVFDIEVVSAK
jgi:FKBP-type peptidyl-prolyl cis-trans isomerase